jgi:hypothetical protein
LGAGGQGEAGKTGLSSAAPMRQAAADPFRLEWRTKAAMGLGTGLRRFAGARVFAALALLALAIRVVLPAGVMPVHDSGRFLAIVLCTGHGTVEAVLDLHTGEVGDPADEAPAHESGQPCFFAATAQHAGPASPPTLIAVTGGFALASDLLVEWPILAPRLAAPPPWATAPPLA